MIEADNPNAHNTGKSGYYWGMWCHEDLELAETEGVK